MALGQGLSVAIGCAIAAKRRARQPLLCYHRHGRWEGQVVAAMLAGAKGLDNLCLLSIIILYNLKAPWIRSCRWSP